MKTLPAPRLSQKPVITTSAFTLIELMVVIVIIGILAGIAIPTLSTIIARAKAKTAFSDASQLQLAIGSYFTEYRKYPTRETGPDDGNRPQFSDHALIDILIPSDAEAGPGGMNRRRHTTISYKNARPMGGGKYRGGVVIEADGSGELWDPWGNYYRVVMDTDYNNRIPSPDFDTESEAIMQSVIVWSPGPDGDDATVEDNIMLWRP